MQKNPADFPASDLASCNCLALRQAARRVTQLYEGHLSPFGLRATQYSILAKLARLGPQSINDLAATMVMDRTTTGRAIRPLERDRLVVVKADDDGRKRVVRITDAGRDILKQAKPHWRKAQAEFETAYGESAAADLRSALKRAVSAVR